MAFLGLCQSELVLSRSPAWLAQWGWSARLFGEEKTFELQCLRKKRLRAVAMTGVADDGVANVSQMPSDLVAPAGLRSQTQHGVPGLRCSVPRVGEFHLPEPRQWVAGSSWLRQPPQSGESMTPAGARNPRTNA